MKQSHLCRVRGGGGGEGGGSSRRSNDLKRILGGT